MRATCVVALALATARCAPSTSPSPAVAIDGVYTLRIESTCAALPAAVRTREYMAAINGTTVSLSGGTFWMHPSRGLMNRFAIGITGTRAGLRFDSLTSSNLPTLVEETNPGSFFGVVGTGSGDVVESGGAVSIAGTLSAGIGWGSDLADDHLHEGCGAAAHQATFRFTRTTSAFVPPAIARTLIRLEVAGPASVAPQQSAQFTAIGSYPDGSTRDVTPEARWNRGVSLAIDVGSTGLVTGRTVGESNVSASLDVPNLLSNISHTREVVVVPPGTVRIAGVVTTGTPAQPVVNATVSVVSGSAAGLRTTTDWEGRYALYGIAGGSEIRVTKDGFEAETHAVSGSAHQTLNLQLQQVAPFPNVGGAYTLTITADDSCLSSVAPPHHVRTYSANIIQNGRALTVQLGGASFFVVEGRGNGFPGLVDPFQLSFQLDDNDHFDVGNNIDVVEQLGGARVLMLLGTITTDITPNRLTGTFDGVFQFADRAVPSNGFFWGHTCGARHQVVFTR